MTPPFMAESEEELKSLLAKVKEESETVGLKLNIQKSKIMASSSISSIQFSHSVVSDSLRPHELQHARLPCSSPSARVCLNSCALSQWCYPTISSSVVPFSSCPQSLPASESFPMSQLFSWGGQSTGVSAVASVLPMNTQDWSPLGWIGWSSLTPQFKSISSLVLSFLHGPTFTSIQDHWKNHSLD